MSSRHLISSLSVVTALLSAPSLALAQGTPEAEAPAAEAEPAEAPAAKAPDAEAAEAGEAEAAPAEEAEPPEVAPRDGAAGSPQDEEAAVRERAERAPPSDHPASRNSFVLGPQVGFVSPHLFSDLGGWPIFGLEAGYILPFDAGAMRRPLQLSLVAHYTQPGASGSGEDPNLGESGASYEWELTEQMLQLELAALWRFIPPGEFLSPYATAGPRAYFTRSVLTASGAGADFGEHREGQTRFGFIAGGGLDLAVGPGTIFGTLLFSWSDLSKRVTGDTSTGAITLDLGYRLYLFLGRV